MPPPQQKNFTSFARFFEHLGDGEANIQASNEMVELGKQLMKLAREQNHDSKGEMTIKLKFTAEPKGVVDVAFNLKVTQPRPKPPSSVLWLDKTGGFTPDNPKQQRLHLEGVSEPRPLGRIGNEPADDNDGDDTNERH